MLPFPICVVKYKDAADKIIIHTTIQIAGSFKNFTITDLHVLLLFIAAQCSLTITTNEKDQTPKVKQGSKFGFKSLESIVEYPLGLQTTLVSPIM